MNKVKLVLKVPVLTSAKGSTQIPLALSSTELPCFANYVAGKNSEVVAAVREFAMGKGELLLYIHGVSGTGVSHLLQASSHLSSELEQQAFYFSLSDKEISVEVLQQLEIFDVLCIDDIHEISGSKEWEEAFFHLFNVFRDKGKRLLIGTNSLPENSNFQLPDLVSRFSGMVRYQLKVLSDEDKSLAIIQRATSYGLKLSSETANFMLTRGPRDLRALMGCVDKLDQASMVSKRAITIPFVKDVFGW